MSMLQLTKVLRPHMKMKLVSSLSVAMMQKFAASASYSTTSLVEEKIWLMLPSHEAKDPRSKKPRNYGDPPKVQVHKWRDSSFYDIRKKSFVTSNIQKKEYLDEEEESVEEVPKVVGSSHGFLAMMKPSDCSLSLIKIPSKFRASPMDIYEVHDLPSIDTLPAFDHKVFRASEFNIEYGEFQVAGFSSKGHGGEEKLKTCKEVADYFVEKIVMSDPRSGDLPTVVMSTHNEHTKLAFCQGFDAKEWINLDTKFCFSDVIYSNRHNKFYGVMNFYEPVIEVWDLQDPEFPKRKILEPRVGPGFNFPRRLSKYYLVESLGEILLVTRHFAYHVAEDGTCLECIEDKKCELPYGTFDFDVYKLSDSGKELHKVENLAGQALFLGINHSFAVSATKFPGIKGNSIYFCDHYVLNHAHFRCAKDYPFGAHDSGIFNLEHKCVTPCYSTESRKLVRPPVWIAPSSTLTQEF